MQEYLINALMGLGGAAGLWLLIRGLYLTQQINAADPEVLAVKAVLRKVEREGRHLRVIATVNADDAVLHLPCRLPLARGKRRPKVTDVLDVYWRRGDVRVVAAKEIRRGQRMLVAGFAVLALLVLAFALRF